MKISLSGPHKISDIIFRVTIGISEIELQLLFLKDLNAKKKLKKKSERETKKTSKDSVKIKTESNSDKIIEVLFERLDPRRVVDHRKFDEDRGQSLEEFLISFEKYCRNTMRGDDEALIDELEKHLTGKTLNAFRGMINFNHSYDQIKRKLLTWYDDNSKLRKVKAKEDFNNAQHENDEDLQLYSIRLEALYRKAYPNKKVESSQRLIEKFIDTLPEPAKQNILATYRYDKNKGNDIGWSAIQQCARVNDAENIQKKARRIEEVGEREIVINVKQTEKNEVAPAKKQDVVGYNRNGKEFSYNGQRANNQSYNGPNIGHGQQTSSFRPRLPPRQFYQQPPQQFRPQPPQQHRPQPPQQFRQQPPQRFPQNSNRFSSPPNAGQNRFVGTPDPRFAIPPQEDNRFCSFCRRGGHIEEYCYMKTAACHYCQKTGHYIRMCQQRRNDEQMQYNGYQMQPSTIENRNTDDRQNSNCSQSNC